MKASHMVTSRFGSPSVMTAETRVLGSSVAEWEEAFTNGFKSTFAEIEAKRSGLLRRSLLVSPFSQPRDGRVALDLASIASEKFAKVK